MRPYRVPSLARRFSRTRRIPQIFEFRVPRGPGGALVTARQVLGQNCRVSFVGRHSQFADYLIAMHGQALLALLIIP